MNFPKIQAHKTSCLVIIIIHMLGLWYLFFLSIISLFLKKKPRNNRNNLVPHSPTVSFADDVSDHDVKPIGILKQRGRRLIGSFTSAVKKGLFNTSNGSLFPLSFFVVCESSFVVSSKSGFSNNSTSIWSAEKGQRCTSSKLITGKLSF